MPTNNLISRTDAGALMPEDVSNDILGRVPDDSAAMTIMRHVTMARGQQRLPIISALPVAYFVNGDTGQKQTTEVNWANRYLNAEELACIVPIPEAVLDDAEQPIWDEVKPLVAEAVGRTLDAAIFFGVNKPSSWAPSLVSIATTASATVPRGTNTAAKGGVAGDISDAFTKIETSGFDVNGIAANRSWKGLLRQARSTQGERLDEVSIDSKQAYGEQIIYPMRGLWPTGSGAAEVVLGDYTQAILGVRKDLTWKLLDQAVIQDNTGAIVYNLAQQDMVALRVVARFGYQVSNVINYDQPVESLRSPWAAVTAP